MKYRSVVIMIVTIAALSVLPRAARQFVELKTQAVERVEQGIWSALLNLHAQQLASAKTQTFKKAPLPAISDVARTSAPATFDGARVKKIRLVKSFSGSREFRKAKAESAILLAGWSGDQREVEGVEPRFDRPLDPRTWRLIARHVNPAVGKHLTWIQAGLAPSDFDKSLVKAKRRRRRDDPSASWRWGQPPTPKMNQEAFRFVTRLVALHQRPSAKSYEWRRLFHEGALDRRALEDALTEPVKAVTLKSNTKLSCAEPSRRPIAKSSNAKTTGVSSS